MFIACERFNRHPLTNRTYAYIETLIEDIDKIKVKRGLEDHDINVYDLTCIGTLGYVRKEKP